MTVCVAPAADGADVAETADVALVAGAEQAQEKLADALRERGQTVAQLLPKPDIHRRFTTHVNSMPPHGAAAQAAPPINKIGHVPV